MGDDAEDFDRVLAKEASEYAKDKEIARILSTFRLDAYSVLDLLPGCSTEDIKQRFRRLSLLIHPDKTQNTRAPAAFDRLRTAQSDLVDDAKRDRLDHTFVMARNILISQNGWKKDDERLQSEQFYYDWRQKTREIMLEEEERRRRARQLQSQYEGREKRKAEEQEEEKRFQRVQEKAWEATRDDRVNSWQSFRKKTAPVQASDRPAKKKKKIQLLG